jgi:hypothetical protein
MERIDTKGNTPHSRFLRSGNTGRPMILLSMPACITPPLLNNTSSVELRFSAKWNISSKSSIAVGYDYSQLQIWGVYFARQENTDGSFSSPNRDLDLQRLIIM